MHSTKINSIYMSPYSLFFFCFYFLSIGDSFRFFRQNFIISKCSHFRMVQTFDSYADITADKDGGILKRIIRRGDYREGTPKDLDIAFISWKFFFLNGSLFHESTTGSRYRFLIPNTINFSDFSIMSPGITIGVKTMNKGETASFILTPKYGLGIRGSPPKTPRNLTFRADVTLLDFEPSNILPYESDSEDSSDCRDEIIENMYTRKLSKRPNGMTAQQYMEMDSSHNQSTISMEEQSHSESHQNNSTFPQALISTNEVTPSREGVEMFDPNKHQLLPSRRIHGKGHGFSWDETPEVIDVEIPLESYQSNVDGQLKLICKTDLDIRIKSTGFSVFFRPLNVMILEGPLFGKINPSQSSWNLDDDDPTSDYREQRLILNLEKSYGHQDLWATVFEKEYLDILQKKEIKR